MLDSFRKRTNNLAFTFLILLIVAVMAMFGIDMSTQQRGSGGAAAFVNGEPISQAEFRQELQARLQQYQQILGAQYDEKLILQLRLPQQTLQQLIQYKLLAQAATKMDFLVTDQQLATHIRSLPYFQVNGKFDATLYKRIPNVGLEERRQRERLQVVRLQDYMQKRIRLAPKDVRLAYGLNETKLTLTFAAIDFDALTSNYSPNQAAINKAMKSTPPEKLQDAYRANIARYTNPARTKIRQIRVGLPFQAAEAKKKEARAKMDKIVKEVNKDNFQEMAKKHSDDEYAKKGGDRGWVTKGTLGSNFEAAIDNLKPGEVSGIIEATSGYFLVQAIEKKEKEVQPFDKVKREVAKEVARTEYQNSFRENKLKDWNARLSKGRSIEGDLRKLKVTLEDTGEFNLGQGYVPKIGAADAVVDASFRLTKKNQVAPELLKHNNNGKLYFVKVKKIARANPKSIEKKWDDVENQISSGLQNEIFNKWLTVLRESADIREEYQFNAESLQRL